MIVLNFIVGLLIVAIVVGVLYGLGLWYLKRVDDYDDNTHVIEVIARGFLVLMIIAMIITVLLLIYKFGELVVKEII